MYTYLNFHVYCFIACQGDLGPLVKHALIHNPFASDNNCQRTMESAYNTLKATEMISAPSVTCCGGLLMFCMVYVQDISCLAAYLLCDD